MHCPTRPLHTHHPSPPVLVVVTPHPSCCVVGCVQSHATNKMPCMCVLVRADGWVDVSVQCTRSQQDTMCAVHATSLLLTLALPTETPTLPCPPRVSACAICPRTLTSSSSRTCLRGYIRFGILWFEAPLYRLSCAVLGLFWPRTSSRSRHVFARLHTFWHPLFEAPLYRLSCAVLGLFWPRTSSRSRHVFARLLTFWYPCFRSPPLYRLSCAVLGLFCPRTSSSSRHVFARLLTFWSPCFRSPPLYRLASFFLLLL
jgi:hypothetical protein